MRITLHHHWLHRFQEFFEQDSFFLWFTGAAVLLTTVTVYLYAGMNG